MISHHLKVNRPAFSETGKPHSADFMKIRGWHRTATLILKMFQTGGGSASTPPGTNMMHNPPHPGEILREDVFAHLGLSVTEAANRFALPLTVLSRVLNGKANISPDLAVRLEQVGTGTAEAWAAMQANYDLWQAQQRA